MNAKLKKYLGPILGLSGGIMFLIAGIISFSFGGYLLAGGGLLPIGFITIGAFGLIGAILGFAGLRSESRCIMLFAAIIALLATFPFLLGVGSYNPILLLIICVFAIILLILGGALKASFPETS